MSRWCLACMTVAVTHWRRFPRSWRVFTSQVRKIFYSYNRRVLEHTLLTSSFTTVEQHTR